MATLHHGMIRCAIVGLGHIAQVAVLPAFAHARRNSRLAALVGDGCPEAEARGARMWIDRTYSSDDYEACLSNVDAVYIALPNSSTLSLPFQRGTRRRARSLRKPMAVTVEECEAMIEACRRHRVKLMLRIGFTSRKSVSGVIDLVRKGTNRNPEVLQLLVSLTVRAGNIRTGRTAGGGTLPTSACIASTPLGTCSGVSRRKSWPFPVNSGAPRLAEIDESTAALLRFDGERVAAFVTSFNAADVGDTGLSGRRVRFESIPPTVRRKA